MTSINLIPPETAARKETRARVRLWGARLGLTALVLAVVYVGLVQTARRRQAEVQRLAGTYAILQKRLHDAQFVIDERDRLAQRFQVISLVRGERTAGSFLELLGDALPPDAYLTSVGLGPAAQKGSEASAPAQGPQALELRVQGRARGQPQVGRLIRELISSGRFQEVNLVSLSDVTDSARGPEVAFEIVCTQAAP